MVGKLFDLAVEMRFEVGSAIVQTNALKNSVNNLSQAADGALATFRKMGLSLVGSFVSGPGGGVLGVLYSAVSAQEEFTKNQVAFANVLGRNTGTFAERMAFAAEKMEEIRKKSQQFGLPAKNLIEFTKLLVPAIAPKLGVEKGTDASINLGRTFLKSAPGLGLDPMIATDQLRRAVLGLSDVGGPLFDVLTQDTKAMKEFMGKAAEFKKLPLAERVQKLTAAFSEFADDTEAVAAMTNTIGGQLTIMKNNFMGMYSILRPLGQVLSGPVIEAMKRFNNYTQDKLKVTFENIAKIIQPWVGDLDRLIATLMQLRDLSGQTQLAGKILFLTSTLVGLQWGMNFLGIRIPFVTRALNWFAASIHTLNGSALAGVRAMGAYSIALVRNMRFSFGGMFTALGSAAMGAARFLPMVYTGLNMLTKFLSAVFAPLILLVGGFQLISRAVAYWKIDNAKTIAGWVDRISELGVMFSRVLSIFDDGFNILAKFLSVSPIMDFFVWIADMMIDALHGIVTTIALAVAGFNGLALAIMEFINQIKNAVTFKGFDSSQIGAAFDYGINGVLERVFDKQNANGGLVQQNNTNIGKVEINNQFKENMQPDRIAFALKEQLQKTAQAPTQAKGRSFTKAATSGAF